jgi:PAS domain S-box-containing protein
MLTVLGTDQDVVQETLLGEALEHAPMGAIVLDETGRYLAVNREACRLTGYPRDELLRLGPADLAADASVVPARLEAMDSGTLVQGVSELRQQDGSLLAIEYRVGETRSGGLPYFVLLFWEHEGEPV